MQHNFSNFYKITVKQQIRGVGVQITIGRLEAKRDRAAAKAAMAENPGKQHYYRKWAERHQAMALTLEGGLRGMGDC